MTTIRTSEITPTDTRAAGWWHSADGQDSIDMTGDTLAEALETLLEECADDEQRAAILAGSIEVSDEPDPGKFYEWTVKIRVSAVWVADGFDLDADRLHAMVSSDLGYATSREIECEIVTAPDQKEIRREQGYNTDSDGVEYSDTLAEAWLTESGTAGDLVTADRARHALAGDPEARADVERWEREARNGRD